jgi:hypothetical protein
MIMAYYYNYYYLLSVCEKFFVTRFANDHNMTVVAVICLHM